MRKYSVFFIYVLVSFVGRRIWNRLCLGATAGLGRKGEPMKSWVFLWLSAGSRRLGFQWRFICLWLHYLPPMPRHRKVGFFCHTHTLNKRLQMWFLWFNGNY